MTCMGSLKLVAFNSWNLLCIKSRISTSRPRNPNVYAGQRREISKNLNKNG